MFENEIRLASRSGDHLAGIGLDPELKIVVVGRFVACEQRRNKGFQLLRFAGEFFQIAGMVTNCRNVKNVPDRVKRISDRRNFEGGGVGGVCCHVVSVPHRLIYSKTSDQGACRSGASPIRLRVFGIGKVI